jgi:thiol-disulfide isomerase/thioredoxin
LLVLAFCFLAIARADPQQNERSAAKPEAGNSKTPTSADAKEQQFLADALQSSANNPQATIENLESFLARFPHSSRREVVLRTLCSYALVANAPDVTVKYGRMLLEMTPDDPELLNLLVVTLSRQNDPTSRNLAIEYNSRLIKITEGERDREAISGESKEPFDEWSKRIATLYSRQGMLCRESGDIGKAVSNYESSYAIYPTASAAEQLGDLTSMEGNSSRAIDYYLTAFAFPEEDPDLLHRQEIRKKLGSLYLIQHHSEDDLGNLILARYDSLMVKLAGRFSTVGDQNAGVQDPFKFVVEKLDGTPLPMAGYQGKVLVVDFWATWCGPCRIQGQLLDKVAEAFHNDSRVEFIALNVDEDHSVVGPFVKQAGWTVPVAYAKGLEQLLNVRGLPTLVIFDRQGRMVDREGGLIPETFVDELTQRLRKVLQGQAESNKP